MKPKLEKYSRMFMLLNECLIEMTCVVYMEFDKFKSMISVEMLKYDF